MEMPDMTGSPTRTAVLLIAHGSRRQDANDDLVRLAGILRNRGTYAIVETAYLELAVPDIPAGGAACVGQGATRVKLLPYFLSAGTHVVDDLTTHRDELSRRFPCVEFELCPPLGLHPLMVDIVLARLEESSARVSATRQSMPE
jgi:sirohydrochlorin ferrochelatase